MRLKKLKIKNNIEICKTTNDNIVFKATSSGKLQ